MSLLFIIYGIVASLFVPMIFSIARFWIAFSVSAIILSMFFLIAFLFASCNSPSPCSFSSCHLAVPMSPLFSNVSKFLSISPCIFHKSRSYFIIHRPTIRHQPLPGYLLSVLLLLRLPLHLVRLVQ